MESWVASGFFTFALFLVFTGASATTFTFSNGCPYTVWPGILSNAGSQKMETTGFELPAGSSRLLQAPTGWSGRFWGRTGCSFGNGVGGGGGGGSCATADCGSGQEECNGAGAAPPATLAEFTLGGGAGLDFYDVSLVDGYNLPMTITTAGASVASAAGGCGATGCAVDVNSRCPAELRVASGDGGGGVACRSACEAFGRPEFCCSGEYGSPGTCKPSQYSEFFKHNCPRAYSYAYDDGTSTFTCSGADYQITFCPASATSQKSSQDSPWTGEVTETPITYAAGGAVAAADNGVTVGTTDQQNQNQNQDQSNDPSFLAGMAIAGASAGGISLKSELPLFISVITLLSSSLLFFTF